MGLHFFMPAHLIPLVEVVRSVHTDPARAERCLLRRCEAEEELRAVRDQLGATDTRCRRHPLRQSATDEPGADARDREDVEILEELLRARGHVRGNVAPQENGDVVALEDRFLGIAREADRVEQDVLTALDRRAPVDRQMHVRLMGHDALEVGKAPGNRDAESRGRRRIELLLQPAERGLEIPLRRTRILCRDARGDEAVVQRRDDDLHALVLDDAELERMLLRSAHPPHALPHRRLAAAQAIHELVDPRAAQRGRRGAREDLTPCQLHAPTRTRPRRIRSRYARVFV